jgi:aminoglycoside phosphotransferase (APT) family kinase protein
MNSKIAEEVRPESVYTLAQEELPTVVDNTQIQTPNETPACHDDADAVSVTSTIGYQHEPFDTFRHRAVELVAKTLNRHPAYVQAHRIKGGSFNRVVALTVASSQPKILSSRWAKSQLCGIFSRAKKTKAQEYVLRIPRGGENDELEREVAILKAVYSCVSLPTPQVISYDVSGDNVLKNAYMLQKRLPGDNLMHTELFFSLNNAQRRSIVKSWISVVEKIASIQGPPGIISLAHLTGSSNGAMQVEKLPVAKFGRKDSPYKPGVEQKPIDHLLEVIEQWLAHHTAGGFSFEEIWGAFAIISRSLEKRGFLDGPNVLYHGDLQPYNLLAEVSSEEEVKITGVFDWDSAMIAPEFMAYRAPFWLWTPEDMDSVEQGEERTANFEPEIADDRELKDLFIALASEKYKRFAFAPEAMLARRMYVLLREGIGGPWQFMEAEKVVKEWNELHPEDGIDYDVEVFDDFR